MSSAASDQAAYWMVAVPNWAASGKARPNAEKTDQQREDERKLTRRALDLNVAKLADVMDFPIPALRVGTLDKLMALSDELHKVDAAIEGVVKKLEKSYRELKGVDEDLSVDGVSPAQYAEGFRWNAAKYPFKAALGDLVERLQEDALNCEEELKKRTDRFSELTASLHSIERKETGTLLVKPLAKLVNEDDLVEGDFLTTLLVVVPAGKVQEWTDTYETLEDAATLDAAAGPSKKGKEAATAAEEKDGAEAAEDPAAAAAAEADPEAAAREARRRQRSAAVRNVVPRSSKELARDEEFVLYRVVVFRKGVDTLKNLYRERRWTVRSYQHDPTAEEDDADRKADLVATLNRKHASLRLWLATTYSESFSSWIHLKAVRIFVESVLRFGIPVEFQAVVLRPRKGYRTKLRKSLQQTYGWLMGTTDTAATEQDKSMDFGGGAEFYPYVYVPLDF